MLPSLYLRLAGAAAILLLLAGGLGWLYHRGYAAGEAHQDAHYGPILAAVQRERDAAIARAAAQDGASARISADIEARHAQTEKDLTDRAAAARVAMLGSLRALTAARGRCAVPGVPGSPALAPGASPGPDRDERFTASLAAVGTRCERDSAALLEWQNWWRREKSVMDPVK